MLRHYLGLIRKKLDQLSDYSKHPKAAKTALISAVVGAAIGVVLILIIIFTNNSPASGPVTPPASPTEPTPTSKTDANQSESKKPSTENSEKKSTSTKLPTTVLNLTNWKLTLPVDTSHSGSPDEIEQPELANYINGAYFTLNSRKDGVIFKAPAGGYTTSGSSYPRSELREMTGNGQSEASWSNTSGSHTMEIREAITHLPSAKPQVVAGQIHDSNDDVVMIRLDKNQLYVEAHGDNIGTLDSNYKLGTVFTVKITASGGHIKVYYNQKQKVDYAKSGSGFYFKAGCYTQSNTSKGDKPDAYGEVIIYALSVAHY